MSVSRRVMLSVAVLMGLALGTLGYQLQIVSRMQRINDELSGVNFVAAAKLLQMMQDWDEVRRMSRRYLAVGDASNRAKLDNGLNETIQRFGGHIYAIQVALRPGEARDEVSLLASAWTEYQQQMERARRLPIAGGLDELPPDLSHSIAHLKVKIDSSYEAVMNSMGDQLDRNRAMGNRAETVSLLASVLFLIAGLTLIVVTLHSINRPLRQLIRGTRKISKGEFSHRLPLDGPTEFAELARDFNAMTERLGELDQMKKDFVAHVSHELNAPLAAIRQTLAVVLAEAPGAINEQQRKLIQLSRKSAERLGALVANLLDASRLEAGTMEYEMSRQNVVTLVNDVTDELAIKAQDRHTAIAVTSDEPLMPIVCDHDRLMQVVGNLIDNALKFSPPHSTIEVKLARKPKAPGSVVTFSVADRGPGVPDASKKDIFLKFHQVHRGGRRAAGQGVGLGLAICRTIVEAHSGRIWVEDNPGGGSIFHVELAAAPAEEMAAKGA